MQTAGRPHRQLGRPRCVRRVEHAHRGATRPHCGVRVRTDDLRRIVHAGASSSPPHRPEARFPGRVPRRKWDCLVRTRAPLNLDLLTAAFPGLFAACWLLASSRERSVVGLVLMLALHILFWTNIGSTLMQRVWITAPA
jgi:hypothetical protein